MIPRSGSKKNTGGYNSDDLQFFERLKADYPDFQLQMGRKFAFRPPRTIIIGPYEQNARLLLLHELGHALSGHNNFNLDIGRLKMEVEAWEKAKCLAYNYGINWDENVMETELDTYRDWLHQKSRCPKCGLTRFETPDGQYHCPRCELI